MSTSDPTFLSSTGAFLRRFAALCAQYGRDLRSIGHRAVLRYSQRTRAQWQINGGFAVLSLLAISWSAADELLPILEQGEITDLGQLLGAISLWRWLYILLPPFCIFAHVIAVRYLRTKVSGHAITVDGGKPRAYRLSERLPADYFNTLEVARGFNPAAEVLVASRKKLAIRFCRTDFDIRYFSLLNKEAFRSGAFSFDISDIIRRNREIYSVNRLSSAFLVEANNTDSVVGMSHVFPLTEASAIAYTNGHLSDSEIRQSHIASPETNWEYLLLFSVGIFSDFRGRYLYRDIFDCFLLHAKTHLVQHVDLNAEVKLIAQIDVSEAALIAAATHMRFEDIGKQSRDQGQLYMLRLRPVDVLDPPRSIETDDLLDHTAAR